MGHQRTRLIYIFLLISVLGFFFHLIWEYAQCSPFYIHLKTNPTSWSMFHATLGDVGILLTSYLAASLFARETLIWPWNRKNRICWILLMAVSAGLAEIIEYFAVGNQLWTYTEINPTVQGISVMPLFQMTIINPLVILTTKKILPINENR